MGTQTKSRVAPARVRNGDVRMNRHRFQGFHERAAKLKINPVQSARQLDEEQTESFFISKLDFWKETNLSATFSQFVREVQPFSESLVQILYNDERIADLLVLYINKKDGLALEPLLDLLSQFTHDLGVRFEKHFARSIATITALAAEHQDIEVIEWTFNALAWLFHYLSRLIVPDLRPTYDILAPLLGRQVKKEHVARFAAEALAFLLRKAGARYSKDPEPLTRITSHILADWNQQRENSQDTEVYEYGLMLLFADTIKDVKASRGVRTHGSSVYRSLLQQSIKMRQVSIVTGVTTSLIHHCQASSFSDIAAVVTSEILTLTSSADTHKILGYYSVLNTMISVRKGDRVLEWPPVFDACRQLTNFLVSQASTQPVFSELPTKAIATLIQSASFDSLVPNLKPLLDKIMTEKAVFDFPQFCLFAWEINHSRFDELLRPYMFRYMAETWTESDIRIIFTSQAIISADQLTEKSLPTSAMPHLRNWPQTVVKAFESWNSEPPAVIRANAFLDLSQVLPAEDADNLRVQHCLKTLIAKALHHAPSYTPSELKFLLGKGLQSHLNYARSRHKESDFTWEQLSSIQVRLGSMPLYLENLIQYFEINANVHPSSQSIQPVLVPNLASPSHALRLASLRLLNHIYKSDSATEAPSLKTMLIIETSPYSRIDDHPWLHKAIIYYCFGLLNFKLAQAWTDAVDVLKSIHESKDGTGSHLIEDIAFGWLQTPQTDKVSKASEDSLASQRSAVNEFQCTNLDSLSRTFSKWQSELSHAEDRLVQKFSATHAQAPMVPENSATQALRVLRGIPELAERRSRRLVPLFLKWASPDDDQEATLLGDVSPESDIQAQRFPLNPRDRKAMLELFGLFQNPSVLHQATEVYSTLLKVLANGEVEIQKAALKAIATWRKAGVKKYLEQLNNLLDGSRFREELLIFLPSQTTENGLTQGERQELVQVLMHLLYGRIIARGSATAGRASQGARRKAVFEALGTFPLEDLTYFVHIALGPLRNLKLLNDRVIPEDPSTITSSAARKMMGFVRLAHDLLDSLGPKLEHLSEELIRAVLFCLSRTGSEISDPGVDAVLTEESITSMSSLHKATRQSGLRCLVTIYKVFSISAVERFVASVDSIVCAPRLGSHFVGENSQSISGLMKLLSTWASTPRSAGFLLHNPNLLPNLIDCLHAGERIVKITTEDIDNHEQALEIQDPPANGKTEQRKETFKSEVKTFIIESIFRPLLSSPQVIPTSIIHKLLLSTARIIEWDSASHLQASAVSLILQITSKATTADELDKEARWIDDQELMLKLVRTFQVMLGMPVHKINGKVKSQILDTLIQILPSVSVPQDLRNQLYQTMAALFSSLRGATRTQLSQAFGLLAREMPPLVQEVAKLCNGLNAVSTTVLDEPDFVLREQAFEKVCSGEYAFGEVEWCPLVHNALYFIKDPDEVMIRKNSTRVLKAFVGANPIKACKVEFPESKLLSRLLSLLQRGASERSEIVRFEYLSVIEHLVKHCPLWTQVSDLQALTVLSEDGESFFDAILHIQHDRRKRALVKLARVARQQQFNSNSISRFLLPLVESFVFDKTDDDSGHSLAAQAFTTIGSLVVGLRWSQARNTLRHYTTTIKNKPELEKAMIRLIGVVIQAMYESYTFSDKETQLGSSMPLQEILAEDILTKLLPPLQSFLHHKDEAVVSLRAPIAVSATRLICMLPEQELEYRLAPVLTDVCNILRSKAQDSRDLSRKTLAEITALIGPLRFSFVLKELRRALSRGYQLHVLAFSLHSLLVQSDFKPGELDYCLPEIMRIVLDDTFGVTAEEKDADGYTNKAKEVKSSKSMDSIERIARISTVSHLRDIILPIRNLLMERMDSKATTKADELFRRIGSGLQQNDAAGSQDTLVFCYEVLQQSKASAADAKESISTLTMEEQQRIERFEIKTKSAKKAPVLPKVSSQQYKFARFAIDLLRVILHRHEHLRTAANLAGFMTPIGDVLIDAQEEVQIAALRLLASIVKVSMTQWDENAALYSQTAFNILRNQPDTNTELAQASIKLITAILRDRPASSLKETHLAQLIKSVVPDLTQPSRQGVTFNLLKAVVSRRIVTNEVYMAMDALAKLFITYGDGSARNQARSIWLQFVATYEQSEKRFVQQLSFLTQNLEYKHSEGRQSVMEAIHFLLGKLDDEHKQKAILGLFIPLISRSVNDEIEACRDMACLLLKRMLVDANGDTLQTLRKVLQHYISQNEKSSLQNAALHVYGLFVETDAGRAEKDLPMLRDRLVEILNDGVDGDSTDWEAPYSALQLLFKLCHAYEESMFEKKQKPFWILVWQFSGFPHAWVKWSAARLLKIFLTKFTEGEVQASKGSLSSASGLTIDHAKLCQLIRSYFRAFRHDIQDWLALEVAENLNIVDVFAGHLKITGDVGDDVDGESDADDPVPEQRLQRSTIRQFYLNRVSTILRREYSLLAKSTILRLLETMTSRLHANDIGPLLIRILQPLNNLTDSSISVTTQADDASKELQAKLVDRSREVMSALHKKMPEGEFINAMHLVQQETKRRREERRNKRRIEAVAEPEKAGLHRMKRRARDKDRRRERSAIERSKRRGW